MINLYVEGYCGECKEFEPEIAKEHYFANGEGFKHDTNIWCKHRDKCRNLYKFIFAKSLVKEIENG